MRWSAKGPISVGIALVVWGFVLTYLFASMAWGELLNKPTAVEVRPLRTATRTAQAPLVQPAAGRCTTADLRRPLPPMPQAKRIVTRYVINNTTHINPAPKARPHVSARTAWLAAKDEMTNPKSLTNPPGGGTGSILFGQLIASTVPPTHRLAWVIILHHTALNVLPRGVRRSPPPNPPCDFGQAYIAVDAATGKWFLGGSQPVIPK